MNKHTPGPWKFWYEPGYCGEINAANGASVCSFVTEPNAANAQLLAAAPDLLEALEAVIRGVPDTWEGVQKAREVIRKAKEQT